MSRGRGLALGAAALVLGVLFVALLLRRQERAEPVRVAEDPAASARPAADLGNTAAAPAESGVGESAAEARVALEPRPSEAGVS
ncbi:MAG: hypothetical protein HOP15_12405, partial [Planctomycetes bacterium]|nr:hypothetical protein [Planctomycetota bacterium]